MGLKGSTLRPEEVRIPRRLRQAPAKEQAEYQRTVADAHNERWRVVARDAEGTEMVREELDARLLKTLSSKARRIAGAMMTVPPEIRREVLGVFTGEGAVRYPWKIAK